MNVMDLDTIDVDAPDLRSRTPSASATRSRPRTRWRAASAARASPRAPPPMTATPASRPRTTATWAKPACSRICVPQGRGRAGGRLPRLCTTAAEIGRYCAATALTWNMHTCSCLWTGRAGRRSRHGRRDRARSIGAAARCTTGASSRTARSMPSRSPRAAPMTARPAHGAVLDHGAARWRAAGASTAGRSSPRSPAPRTITASCAARRGPANRRRAATRCISRCPANGAGRRGRRRLGSARHARHGLAHPPVQGRLRRRRRHPDAARRLLPGGDALAAHVPDPVADLSRDRPGRLRLHRALPARRDRRRWRREAAPVAGQAARGGPDVHHAAADEGAVVPGDVRGARRPDQGTGRCARSPRSTR